MKSNIVKIALAVVVIVLGYLLFSSIMKPIRFQEELTKRNERIVEKLKDIRTAQTFFKQFNNRYTSSFDSLFTFLRTGQIPVVKMIPDPTDTTFSRTINDTIGYIAIADSLYSKRPDFKLEDMSVIPFSDGRKFEMKTAKIDKGGTMVSVLEILVPYEYYLFDLNNQLVINLKKEMEDKNKFAGLKVGSMTDASTDGNWE